MIDEEDTESRSKNYFKKLTGREVNDNTPGAVEKKPAKRTGKKITAKEIKKVNRRQNHKRYKNLKLMKQDTRNN